MKVTQKITQTFVRLGLGMGLAGAALSSQAFQITRLSPQGEVAQVRQLVVKFDDAAVNFGDPKAAAPLSISCSEAMAAGSASVNGRLSLPMIYRPGCAATYNSKPVCNQTKALL